MTEEGVEFASHIDGSKHMLSPETSMAIQRDLGSDIVMSFDECTPYPADEATAAASMRLSMRWARRSKDAFGDRPGHALFGIQQGSVYPELRAESAEALTGIGFDGYAIGGLAVGEGQEQMFGVLDYAPGQLPGRPPALPDGRRQARRPGGCRGARGRHVRLRPALAIRSGPVRSLPGAAS